MAVSLFVDMFAVLLFLFVYVVNSVSADDVVGCGGFVKSDVQYLAQFPDSTSFRTVRICFYFFLVKTEV